MRGASSRKKEMSFPRNEDKKKPYFLKKEERRKDEC